jgi:hypothetical protein
LFARSPLSHVETGDKSNAGRAHPHVHAPPPPAPWVQAKLFLYFEITCSEHSPELYITPYKTGGFFWFFSSMYCIQHCFICRPSDSTVSKDAGIEPRTVTTSALAVRHSKEAPNCSLHYTFYVLCQFFNTQSYSKSSSYDHITFAYSLQSSIKFHT